MLRFKLKIISHWVSYNNICESEYNDVLKVDLIAEHLKHFNINFNTININLSTVVISPHQEDCSHIVELTKNMIQLRKQKISIDMNGCSTKMDF